MFKQKHINMNFIIYLYLISDIILFSFHYLYLDIYLARIYIFNQKICI